jgi:uncharacterized protein (DUF1330 family)
MAKGYWITLYHSVSKPNALAEYAQKASPVIESGGGSFLVRGPARRAYENGAQDRCVVIEFESVERAIAVYESSEYQAAAKLLKGAVERDVRMAEGI